MPVHDTWQARPTLTIWIYDSPMGAAAGEVRLKELVRRGAVAVVDAVTVTWVRGTHRPRIGHLRNARVAGASRDSLLGSLIDAVTATGPGAERRLDDLCDQIAGTGIDHALLRECRAALAPHTSALLVLTRGADLDAVRPVIERGVARGDTVLLHAHLSDDAPQVVRATLARVDHRAGAD